MTRSDTTSAEMLIRATPPNYGWEVDYGQVSRISRKARCWEDVSMEQAEAVILAMIELGFIAYGDGQ